MIYTKSYYLVATILAFFILLETVSFTYMQQEGATYYYSSSLLYFFSGLAICLLPLLSARSQKTEIKKKLFFTSILPYIMGAFFCFIIGYHLNLLIEFYKHNPIDKRWEDMLPAIQVGCRRFLTGQKIYAPTPEMWPDTVFQYLPTMWMPFLPAEFFSFDYRWATFFMQSLGLCVAFVPLVRAKEIPLLPALIGGVGIFLFINFFLVKNSNYWILTEEGVVTGFYLLLACALLKNNYWLIGLCITGCTLSRYSLVFWIPTYFVYAFLSLPRKSFVILCLSYGLSMSLLFVFPFFIKDPAYFFHIPATYTRFIDSFWANGHLEEHQYFNVGFYKFFTSKTAHSMNIWAALTSFISPIILLMFLRRLKGKIAINEKYIPFATFKLSLIFFFSYIAMPYQYVFVPATLISYAVLFIYIAQDNTVLIEE
jgi:hypothetical protein